MAINEEGRAHCQGVANIEVLDELGMAVGISGRVGWIVFHSACSAFSLAAFWVIVAPLCPFTKVCLRILKIILFL